MLIIAGDADARRAFWWPARHARDAGATAAAVPVQDDDPDRPAASDTVPDAGGADHRSAPLVVPGDALRRIGGRRPSLSLVIRGGRRTGGRRPSPCPWRRRARLALAGAHWRARRRSQESVWVALLAGFGFTDPAATSTTHRGYLRIGTSTSDAHPAAVRNPIAYLTCMLVLLAVFQNFVLVDIGRFN